MDHVTKTGVLFIQLGTPSSPTPTDVRRYLSEFLSDPRVVDLPRFFWLPLLHGIILRTRPKRSAHLYGKIWLEKGGSPLLFHTKAQVEAVAQRLGPSIMTLLAMRYGQPSIPQALEEMRHHGVTQLLIFPLFPQYASATTGSTMTRIFQLLQQQKFIPSLRFTPPFFDNQEYIQALAQTLPSPPPEAFHLLLSFHGLPQRHILAGDPYEHHCRSTAALLAKALSLAPEQWSISFQSRFGREAWLQPATTTLLTHLPAQGKKHLILLTPGFTADCLETLEEMAISGKKIFLAHGGIDFRFIPCLNQTPAWIQAMETITRRELSGWMEPAP